VINTLRALKVYEFKDLSAITEADVRIGLLPSNDIEKLRIILKNGFRDNKTMQEIERDIRDTIPLRDRITENGNIIEAARRPEMIARTETLRVANVGLIDTYKQNGIKQVRWLAALSDRTCEECADLNGQIMTNEDFLDKRNNIHPLCRCSALAYLEK
jgi:SPP1 gp7 family putative phage head morphogenesis protein